MSHPSLFPGTTFLTTPIVLTTVVSGGQTGVDQAALRSAKAAGLTTGGWAPHGFMTLDGPKPRLGVDYGLREAVDPRQRINYSHRTSLNVMHSGATLRIAETWGSSGEIATMREIKRWGRPYFDVNYPVREVSVDQTVGWILEWLADHAIMTLNVAGNSERTAPGIGLWTEEFLTKLWTRAQAAVRPLRKRPAT